MGDSRRISIKVKSCAKKLIIKYICPKCDKRDELTFNSPLFNTGDIAASVERKLEYLWSQSCLECRAEMDIKELSCVLY